MAYLEIEQLVKRYGSTVAVDHLDLEAERGRILGLLGPNGAGKTSTIRVITFILLPDGGTVTLQGRPVGSWSQKHIGYLPEERGLYRKMEVGEQLVYLARLKGMSPSEAEAATRRWLDRFDASDWYGRATDELSKGMQQKIQFIATLLHDPDLLIFDEPFSGLDPLNADLLREIILDLKDEGHVVLFASHRMEQVERLCDDICLMAEGRAVISGSLREVKRSFGKNTVEIAFGGAGSFVDDLVAEGRVRVVERGPHHAELRLLEGTSGRDVLETALAASGEVTGYELVEPSLGEIFAASVSGEHDLQPVEAA